VPGIKPVTRLPFGVCAVAKWCGACHLIAAQKGYGLTTLVWLYILVTNTISL